MNLYNFQNLFLFSRNFTIWIGLQLVSQSDSFQALGSCFYEKYSHRGKSMNQYIARDIPRYYNREYEIDKNESKTALPGKKLGMKVKVSYYKYIGQSEYGLFRKSFSVIILYFLLYKIR